ncbi:putative ATP-dependent RNA helicase SoYb [Drosophila ficusphila]|uniref:putative ATP-dependent RNA helicase SoYb n=1 Tax=Drosophila ficusphila TaxID=30025 RepID=UPI001C8A7A60|nr:putative ATP-dependent RNA helicase SoYb [Drosophila ficusphila]
MAYFQNSQQTKPSLSGGASENVKWLSRRRPNLTSPAIQPQKLDALLRNREPLRIPTTGKVLSKVQGTQENSVQTVFGNRINQLNQDSSDKITCLENKESKPVESTKLEELFANLKMPETKGKQEHLGTKQKSGKQSHESLQYKPAASAALLPSSSSLILNRNAKEQSKSSPVTFSMDKVNEIFNGMLSKNSSEGFKLPSKMDKSNSYVPSTSTDDLRKKTESFVGNRKNSNQINLKDFLCHSVLAHSPKPGYPDTCNQNISFCEEIQMSLDELNFQRPIETQLYAWPHLLNRGSLVLVNGSRTGRSWSYLPVLCNSVLRSLENIPSTNGNLKVLGPLALLVADSVETAKKLTTHCDFLLKNYSTNYLKVVNTHAHPMIDVYRMLLGSCGILVTTPSHLLGILTNELNLVDPARLEFLIFDDIDRMRLESPELLGKVLQIVNGLDCPMMQLVVVAQQWHKENFKKLLKQTVNPLILIGDFFKAAIYGGLILKFLLKSSALKANQLLDVLSTQEGLKRRTLIYCQNQLELENLQNILTKGGHQCIDISKAGNQEPNELLLVSDEDIQEELRVRNIELLIHFNVPESWSRFTVRFYTMAESIPNFFKVLGTDKPPVTYLMLDETNAAEWHRTLKSLQSLGATNDWMSELMPRWNHKSNNSRVFCESLLSSGNCNRLVCDKRHHFVKADLPHPDNLLQEQGTVIRGKIFKIYDPAHFAVWPIKYKCKDSTNWMDVPYPFDPSILMLKMNLALKEKSSKPYNLNDVFFLMYHEQVQRVRIMDVRSSSHSVTVQFMDHGTEFMEVKTSELLKCPKEFKTIPPLSLDIRLSGVVSAGEEGQWSAESIEWVQSHIEGQDVLVTVDLAIMDLIYAEEITSIEECRTMKTTVNKIFLRRELLRQGFAKNGTLMETMRFLHMHRKADLEMPTIVDSTRQNKKGYNSNKQENGTDEPKTVEENKLYENVPDSNKENILSSINRIVNEESAKTEEIQTGIDEQNTETPAIDSSTALLNAVINELNTKSPSKKEDTQKFLHSIINTAESQEVATKKSCPRALKLEQTYDVNLQEPSKELVAHSLQCATKAGESVHPRVKWHQTHTHIELVIEQQVSEYNLVLEGYSLIYSVTTTTPPQRCVLNLLGEVIIESVKQHGYFLHVRLAKVNLLIYWPSLLNSLYAQKHSPWLVYDTERAEGPPPSKAHVLWKGYQRQEISKRGSNPEEEEFSSAPEDFSEPEVEFSEKDSILYEDC